MRREDDRVTRWLKDNWRDPLADSRNLVPAMVFARLVNNPDSLALINPLIWDMNEWIEILKIRRASGMRVLNPAYIVSTCGVSMDKLDYIGNLAQAVYDENPDPEEWPTLEGFHERLMKFKGLGSFLAAQVVADLKHVQGCLTSAPDWATWCAPGPGSRRGLQAVLGGSEPSDKAFLGLASQLYSDICQIQGEDLRICMQDFQNCLCEFSKYFKAYNGTGKPKQRYSGG